VSPSEAVTVTTVVLMMVVVVHLATGKVDKKPD
jgi:hypothetical protein